MAAKQFFRIVLAMHSLQKLIAVHNFHEHNHEYELNHTQSVGSATLKTNRLLRSTKTLDQLISEANDLTTFSRALSLVDLETEVAGLDPITVFSPTNSAFDRQPQSFLERIFQPAYRTHLKDLLLYHFVLEKELPRLSLKEGFVMHMANGGVNRIRVKNGRTFIRAVPQIGSVQQWVEQSDNFGDNGVYHKIFRVMTTKWMVKALNEVLMERFTDFNSYMQQTEWAEYLGRGDLTVLAPSNRAMAAMEPSLKEGLAKDTTSLGTFVAYHILPQIFSEADLRETPVLDSANEKKLSFSSTIPAIKVNGVAAVENGDILANNGIVHGIDNVLIPPELLCPDVALENRNGVTHSPAPDEGEDDVETALGALSSKEEFLPFFELLQASSVAKDLADTASNLTIFVPSLSTFQSDDRAQMLPCLMENSVRLDEFIGYHVIPNVTLREAKLRETVKLYVTLSRKPSIINGYTSSDGRIQVNDAGVVGTEYVTESGGVIHIVNRILIFPGFTCP